MCKRFLRENTCEEEEGTEVGTEWLKLRISYDVCERGKEGEWGRKEGMEEGRGKKGDMGEKVLYHSYDKLLGRPVRFLQEKVAS